MKKTFKYLDKPLLIVSVLLFIFGLIMVFSASNVIAYMSHEVSASHYFVKQAIFLFIGLILSLIMIRFPTKSYGVLSWGLLAIFTVSLVILLMFVDAKNQARSWFQLGPISIQPSEFIKVITIVWLAYFYEIKQKKLNTYTTSLFPMFVCPFALI